LRDIIFLLNTILTVGWAVIKALEDKILKEGTVLPGDILKVDCFLNHRIDVPFLLEMGKEVARLYENQGVNKILTIETSGIPIAFAAAQFMNVPVVFVKKNKSDNISDTVYSSRVTSFTRKNVYDAVVSKEFLGKEDSVLIIDDFLAKGNALNGLMDIVNQAGANLVGCAIAIEKGFQGGGDELRAKGIRVDSLAIVESMTDSSLTFRK
jgi:xanthine phosphoribosyltransferase